MQSVKIKTDPSQIEKKKIKRVRRTERRILVQDEKESLYCRSAVVVDFFGGKKRRSGVVTALGNCKFLLVLFERIFLIKINGFSMFKQSGTNMYLR